MVNLTLLYQLCPLPATPGAIRLLRLHPATDWNAPLTATLFATSLSESKGTYLALSYCWGDESQRSAILVDVHVQGDTNTTALVQQPLEISITRSLADALHDLRHTSMEWTVWADAICINQNDNAEKSVQVRQMLQVYQSSQKTIANLGRDTTDLQAAVAHMDYLRTTMGGPAPDFPMNDGHPKKGIARADERSTLAAGAVDPFFRTLARLPEPDTSDSNSPRNLGRGEDVLASPGDIEASWKKWFSFPWFTRAWTTQEFVAAPNVLFQIGPSPAGTVLFTLSDMVRLIVTLQHQKRPLEDASMLLDHILGCGGAMKLQRMLTLRLQRNLTIGDVYHLFESSEQYTGASMIKAGDPRDRLWAILSLSNDQHEPALQADYNLTVREVYLRFSRHMIAHGGVSRLLAAAPHTSSDMPSWCLTDGNWVQGQRLSHMQLISGRTVLSEWQRQSQPQSPPPPPVIFSPDGARLRVPGILADRLTWVSPQLPEYNATTFGSLLETHPILHSVIKAIDEAAAKGDPNGSFFTLPPESPDRAVIEFFRGITFNYDRKSEYTPGGKSEYNARWAGYLRPWLESSALALEILKEYETLGVAPQFVNPTRAKELVENDEKLLLLVPPGSAKPRGFAMLYNSPFFEKVRRDGWPRDMIEVTGRVVEEPPHAAPSERGGEDLGPTFLLVLQRFLTVIWFHFGWRIGGWRSRRVGRTELGYLCNLDPRAEVGDYIALMESSHATVLRKLDEGEDVFRIVGQAYVHRLQEGVRMYGQAMENIWLS